jgi:hypothetical protein
MPLTHYSKFSMITLRIWLFKSGVLKNVFILSKYGTQANIRSTKMANNRHAYNRDVLQSYWTSDGLPLYCGQPTGEKTQPPTSYKPCVYGWQRQASSFKSSNRLHPERSRDFCSLANHAPGFESHIAYLGHVRPSYIGSGTSCAKHSSVGSSIASGIAAAITTGHPTSNWRDETQGWGRRPSTWGLHPVLNFEQYMS